MTVGELIKRGSLDMFIMAFDAVKVGADDLKTAILVQKRKASFGEAVKLSEERFNLDMEAIGCTRNENGNGWLFPLDAKAREAAIKRASDYMTEELVFEEALTVQVTKDEHLRKLIDMDANLILAGIISIPALEA